MPDKTTRRTLARQWELLKLLPSSGSGRSASELTQAINAIGFAVSKRQIERDLLELAEAFALECNDKSMPYGWKWPHNASADLPGLTVAEALSLHMAKDAVQAMLPSALLQALEPRFAQADKKLQGLQSDAALAQWPDKVRSVSPALTMLAPKVATAVLQNVQEALLANEQLEVQYQSMAIDAPHTTQLHPLALVTRGLVTYLVATARDYDDVLLYALHRISEAKRLYAPSQRPPGFDLDAYIAGGALQFGSTQLIPMTAKVADHLSRLLLETPLSADQTLEEGRLRATVQDTWQLEWWLLSQGESIVVTGPQALRERIKARLQRTLAAYGEALD